MTEKEFGTLPERRVFCRLCIPNVLSNLFSTIYMMADGVFVGQFLGSQALAAVNLIWPFLSMIFALSDMVAIGCAVKVSTALGAGEEQRACRIFSAGIGLTMSIGLPFLLIVTPFLQPILGVFIRDPALSGLAEEYARVYLHTMPLIMPLFALDNFLRITGKANYSMAVNVSVSLLNILLDWLLIAHLGMGMWAAAAASVASMLIGMVFSLIPFLRKQVTLRFTLPKISFRELWGILYNGSSEYFSNITGSVMSVIINGLLLTLGGGVAVAAYSIVMYIDSLLMGFLYALGDSLQPAVSYNMGAGKPKRVKKLFRICGSTAAVASLVCMAGILLFPRPLAMAFADGQDLRLLDLSVTALLLFAPSYLFKWYNLLSGLFLTALDRPGESILVTFFQAVVCPAVSMLLLVPLFGTGGIFFSHTMAAALTAAAAFFIWRRVRKNGCL